MSGYLIDTHIFLWALFEPEKLPPKASAILPDAENEIFVSVVTPRKKKE